MFMTIIIIINIESRCCFRPRAYFHSKYEYLFAPRFVFEGRYEFSSIKKGRAYSLHFNESIILP